MINRRARKSDYGNDRLTKGDGREHREAKTALQLLRAESRNKAARPYRARTLVEAEQMECALRHLGRESIGVLRENKLTRNRKG